MKNTKLKLLFSIIILIISVTLVSQLRIESNMEEMLPANSESLEASKDFEQYFDGDDQVYIVVKKADEGQDDSLYHQEAEKFLEDLNHVLTNKSYVDSILYKMSYEDIKPYAWEFISLESFKKMEIFIDNNDIKSVVSMLSTLSEKMNDTENTYIENEDRSHYLMVIKPNIDTEDFVTSRMTFYNGLQKELAHLIKDYETLDAGVTGGAFIQDLEGDSVAFNGFFSTFVVTLILILALVILFFGSLKLPILSAYPLLIGALVAAASAYLIYGSLNMFSVSFALLLIGLGIDFAVHLIARYQEERRKGITLENSIKQSVKSTGGSIIIGAATTAFAFGTFAFAQFKAFEQMGIVSAIGLMALCAMMILLIPVLIYLFDKQYKPGKITKGFIWLEKLAGFNRNHRLIVSGLVMLILISVTPNVLNFKIQSDLTAVYPKNIPSAQWTDELKKAFDYDPNTITFYADDFESLEDMTYKLKNLDSISNVDSILSYMPKDGEQKLNILLRLKEFLQSYGIDELDQFALTLMTYDDLPVSLKENYVGNEGKLRGEIVPSIIIYNYEDYQQLLRDVMAITGKHPVGLPTIMNEITVLVKEDMIMISILCIIVIFIITWIASKKLKITLQTILPLLLTLYITIGILPIFGVEVNIFSIAAFPLIIGIGIDSSIHLMHRLREVSSLTLPEKVKETGKPIILTCLTTIIGFGSLANINHPGMSNLGLTVAIGIGISMVLTLVLIPIMNIE